MYRKIDKREFTLFLIDLAGEFDLRKVKSSDVDQFMKHIDIDRSGDIDFTEFQKWWETIFSQ